jgi:hypothetical protein
MSTLKPYKSKLQFLACLAALWMVVYALPAAMSKWPVYRAFKKHLEANSVTPTALFYTEEPHTLEAARVLENRIRPSGIDPDPEVPVLGVAGGRE